ncbi:MAG: hypothetical protein AAGE01_22160 [Pseudomonadota bacterium]
MKIRIATLLTCLAGAATAQDSPFALSVSAGAEYDSNVAISEIDQNSRLGDWATLGELALDYERQLGTATSMDVGYAYSSTAYQELDTFDRATHTAKLRLDHEFGSFDGDVSYYRIHARLDDEGLFDMDRYEVSLSRFVAKGHLLRGAITHAETTFEDRGRRDSDDQTIGVDWYYFANGVRRYFLASFDYRESDAVGQQFDYDAHILKLKANQRIQFRGRDARLSLEWRYEDRAYGGLTPSIGAARDDSRSRIRLGAVLPLTDRVAIETRVTYDVHDSNLPSADYTSEVFSVQLVGDF